MDTQLLYTEASYLLENGLTKDAYVKFISAVELSTQQLHGVKFVHQTIVSTPVEYDKLLSIIRSSLNQLEHIVLQTSFTNKNKKSTVNTPPPLPPKPPVPPKPTISNKRPVPPLPPLAIVTTDFTIPSSDDQTAVTHQRPRANSSVTFADRRHTIPFMDDDEEEDDEEEKIMNALKSIGTEKSSYPIPLPQRKVTTQQPDRLSPLTITNTTSTTLEDATSLMLDPYDLVPAQTNTAESMALPISPTCTTDLYVPKIPASPLLGMHRQLQQQLDFLLTQQQPLAEGAEQEQQTASIATVRRLLNNVRTVYMSAMTVPTLLDFSPQLMAYQLTLIESAIFRAIPPEALQQHRAVAKQPHPNIVASTDFFNYLTRVIEHTILLPQEASHRAEIVHRWIKIATQCLALNNYQTLKAIVSALGTPPVQRLKRTWECIPKKRMNRLEVLTALMSEADNYSRYRQHIRSLVPNCQPGRTLHQPMVPFLGVLIHDMTYVMTAKTTTHSGMETATATTADDPRAIEILNWIRTYQRCPAYSLRPPAHYFKKKNGFFVRQAQAIQQYYTPSSNKTPSSPTTTVTSTPSTTILDQQQQQQGSFNMTPLTLSSTHQSTTSDPDTPFLDATDQQDSVKVEQQRITHYILMRPWVNEKIIDELSQLREAPRRPVTIDLVRTNSHNSTLNNPRTYHDSMLSMTTTSTNRSTWDSISTPEEQQPRRSFGSFWPWRKSGELVPKLLEDDRSVSKPMITRTPPPTPSRQLRSSASTSHQRSASMPGAATH
ncbi:ras guanine nucleotide exchange factor domain-containing protein [Chlamydoabsidia padenii]|nr:ras guanine nucleotide exchange factor domain-containing protein [Chlamydoabsidia padenii]